MNSHFLRDKEKEVFYFGTFLQFWFFKQFSNEIDVSAVEVIIKKIMFSDTVTQAKLEIFCWGKAALFFTFYFYWQYRSKGTNMNLMYFDGCHNQ